MFKYVAGNKLSHAISMSSSILKKGKIDEREKFYRRESN